jgi:hypothetical protein
MIPKSAQAVYIGLIPDLKFKIVCYKTQSGFYVESTTDNQIRVTHKSTGTGYFQTDNKNRCIKDAWTLNTGGYAQQNYQREDTQTFLQGMLDISCQLAGINHKHCWILETL